MDPWDNHLLGGMECRKEIWYITKVQMVLLRIEERLIWTFSVILPVAVLADAIILKHYIKPVPLTPLATNRPFLMGLSFSDRGQAWRLPSNIGSSSSKLLAGGTWTATRTALPYRSFRRSKSSSLLSLLLPLICR
jgi:hypothetical protein